MYSYFWLLVLGFTVGYFLVMYLTAHPLQMSIYLFLTSLALFTLVIVVVLNFKGYRLLTTSLLALAAFLSGYSLQTSIVLGRGDHRVVPDLKRQAGDPGKGHTAVIYFTHGEPETYDPIGWLNQFREFDRQGIPFVPFLARPMFIYQLRQAYLKVGQSQHRQVHLRMAQKLEEALRQEGQPDVTVYTSFLDDEPRPDAALIRALNEGASRVVVAEVFVSISNHTLEGEEQINSVDTAALGVPICFTGPLWDSATMYQMFLAKTNAAIGETPPAKVGVLLVGHGQPDEWDEQWPTETEHELHFRQQVLDLLVANGYQQQNVSLAWMEFRKPRPAEKVNELLANGVEKIVYFSAAISADSIHSQYDVPELIRKAQIPKGFPLINLGAWNDHPLAIQAIKEKVQEEMMELAKQY
jgi:protoheme ferro-lyase